MTPDILPVWQITQGISFYFEALTVDDYPVPDSPIADWADHTAAVKIYETLDADPFWTGTAVCTADGYLTLTIAQATTATFTTGRRIGGSLAAEAQITITDPTGQVVMIWQAPVQIFRSLAA